MPRCVVLPKKRLAYMLRVDGWWCWAVSGGDVSRRVVLVRVPTGTSRCVVVVSYVVRCRRADMSLSVVVVVLLC